MPEAVWVIHSDSICVFARHEIKILGAADGEMAKMVSLEALAQKIQQRFRLKSTLPAIGENRRTLVRHQTKP